MFGEGQVRKEEGTLTSPSPILGPFCPGFWGAGAATPHSDSFREQKLTP